jgi:predicted ATPase
MVIRTPDRRLRVFISSTLGEMAEERQVVERAVAALRMAPVMFELGARPHPPRDLYRAYLAQSDIFVGLYWQSYGQLLPDGAISGLEDEFDLSEQLPRLLYVKEPASSRDSRLASLLTRIGDRASYRRFRTTKELARLVRNDLATLLSERFSSAPSSSTTPARHTVDALPGPTTSLVGRDKAVEDIAELVRSGGTRMVTLTGPGGVGKTRLAIAVGEQLRTAFAGGTVFVPLDETPSDSILASVARAAGLDIAGAAAPLQALSQELGDDAWLLILDDLDHAIEGAATLEELLHRCAGVSIVATSRSALRVRGEHEFRTPPLTTQVDENLPVAEAERAPAVALFVDRARAINRDFVLTDANLPSVVRICRRLDGLPLAIELAAARTRLLDPDMLLDRLTASLDVLGTGPVDAPARQRTLRATVEWSIDLLDEHERSALEALAVFAGGWTLDAGAAVAALNGEGLDVAETLAQHSLVELDHTRFGPRSHFLETMQRFVAERLSRRPDETDVRNRHAVYFRDLAEGADLPLRGTGLIEWLDRLQMEAGNLAIAIDWLLANDPRSLPHLFRILWLFWSMRDHMPEAREWVGQLRAQARHLTVQGQAELSWVTVAAANDVGDDQAALGECRRLAADIVAVADPFLRAISRLAIGWTVAITGDLEQALTDASASLTELRQLDEPVWTAKAAGYVGSVELDLGRHTDAEAHLVEARERSDEIGDRALSTSTRATLSRVELQRGNLVQARADIDQALTLSTASRSTRYVSISLAAAARLAFADGDPERAVLIAAGAQGLRRRAGFRAWAAMRGPDSTLLEQARNTVGDKFDRLYQMGSQLTQPELVVQVRQYLEASVGAGGPQRQHDGA